MKERKRKALGRGIVPETQPAQLPGGPADQGQVADHTHAMLVELAARWLRSTRRCAVVATERTCQKSDECPDAIGWSRTGASILVEAKISVADYLTDLRKPHRAGGGMGRERWYLTPWGLLAGRLDELPAGWGLLGVRNGKVYRVVEAADRGPTPEVLTAEMPLLVAIAQRCLWGLSLKGLSGTAPPVEGADA